MQQYPGHNEKLLWELFQEGMERPGSNLSRARCRAVDLVAGFGNWNPAVLESGKSIRGFS
jgi:hypothetical protein